MHSVLFTYKLISLLYYKLYVRSLLVSVQKLDRYQYSTAEVKFLLFNANIRGKLITIYETIIADMNYKMIFEENYGSEIMSSFWILSQNQTINCIYVPIKLKLFSNLSSPNFVFLQPSNWWEVIIYFLRL